MFYILDKMVFTVVIKELSEFKIGSSALVDLVLNEFVSHTSANTQSVVRVSGVMLVDCREMVFILNDTNEVDNGDSCLCTGHFSASNMIVQSNQLFSERV